jgi:hypothetical protein
MEQGDLPTLDAQHFQRPRRKLCQRYQVIPAALLTLEQIQHGRHWFFPLQKISAQYKS